MRISLFNVNTSSSLWSCWSYITRQKTRKGNGRPCSLYRYILHPNSTSSSVLTLLILSPPNSTSFSFPIPLILSPSSTTVPLRSKHGNHHDFQTDKRCSEALWERTLGSRLLQVISISNALEPALHFLLNLNNSQIPRPQDSSSITSKLVSILYKLAMGLPHLEITRMTYKPVTYLLSSESPKQFHSTHLPV